jgi:hypothetical protein
MARQRGGEPAAQPSSAGDGLGGLLASLLGEQTGNAATQPAAPGFASMLDLNGDGNALDDILRMAGKAMR